MNRSQKHTAESKEASYGKNKYNMIYVNYKTPRMPYTVHRYVCMYTYKYVHINGLKWHCQSIVCHPQRTSQILSESL